MVDGTITRIATQVPGSVLLYNVFQNGGRSRSTGSEVVWQQTVSPRLSLTANASVYRRTVDAFSVINLYPQPVPYSAERQELTSGNVKLDANRQAIQDQWPVQIVKGPNGPTVTLTGYVPNVDQSFGGFHRAADEFRLQHQVFGRIARQL